MNFKNARCSSCYGYPDQPIMKGFEAQQAEQSVAVQLSYDVPQSRARSSTPTATACGITVSVPTLQKVNDEGDIKGTKVSFGIECQSDGGGYQQIGGTITISGKTDDRATSARSCSPCRAPGRGISASRG